MAAPEIFWAWGVLDWGAYRASSMEVDPTTSAAGTMADGGWAPNPRPVVLRGYDRAGNLIHTVRSEVVFPDSLDPEFYYRPEYYDPVYDTIIPGRWYARWYTTMVVWNPDTEEWSEDRVRAQQYAWGGTQLDPLDYQWWTPAQVPRPHQVWPLDNGNLLVSWATPTSIRAGGSFRLGWSPDPVQDGGYVGDSGTSVSPIAYTPGYVLTLHNRDGYLVRNLSHLPWKPVTVVQDPDGEHFYMAGYFRPTDQHFYSVHPGAEPGGFHYLFSIFNTSTKRWPHMGQALLRKFDSEGNQVWESMLGVSKALGARLQAIHHMAFVGSRLFTVGVRQADGDPRIIREVNPADGSVIKQATFLDPARPTESIGEAPRIELPCVFAEAGMFMPAANAICCGALNSREWSQLIDYDLNRIGTYRDVEFDEIPAGPDDGLGDTDNEDWRKIRSSGMYSAAETDPNVVHYHTRYIEFSSSAGANKGRNTLNLRVYQLSSTAPTISLIDKKLAAGPFDPATGYTDDRRAAHIMPDGWAYGDEDSLRGDATPFSGYGWPHGNYQIGVYRHFLTFNAAGVDQWQQDLMNPGRGLNASGGEGLDRHGFEVWSRTEKPPTTEQYEYFRYTDGYGREISPHGYNWDIRGTGVMRDPMTPTIAVPIALAVPELVGDQSLRPGGIPLGLQTFAPSLERRYVGRLLPEVYQATVGAVEVILSLLIIRRTPGRVALTAIAPVSDPAIITALGSVQGQDLVITRGFEFVGGLRQMDFFLSVPLRTARMDSGAGSASLTLEGEAPEPAGTGRQREVLEASVERGRDGGVTVRSPQADTYIRPGDRLEGAVVVEEIQLSISPVSTEMVLMGAEE